MLTALGLIALAILLEACPAGAHSAGGHLLDMHAGAASHSMEHGGFLVSGLLVVGLALLAGLGVWPLLCRVHGRAIAVALSLVLTVFGFETALHSVHHLADPESGAQCPVLSGSQNLSWEAADLAVSDSLSLDVSIALPGRSEDSPRWQLHRPSRGRAPPA